MASLIQGYEYDIFKSYRQKDDKGDMWVSEVVKAHAHIVIPNHSHGS